MSFSVAYDWPARVALLERVHWRIASDIDATVLRFAATRAAVIPRAPAYTLRAAGHRIVLVVDREARLVTVLRIYRA